VGDPPNAPKAENNNYALALVAVRNPSVRDARHVSAEARRDQLEAGEMALTPGTRFGTYEIVAPIGAGGMGEVYRAHDASLKRDVAIKVLPASLAGDADRLARFQREAETLAALNHSNIAHIYGLERSGDTTALVMELVEGPTLAERIERGPIPAEEALGIALQITDALEAAHSRGIVHRDLKPANIKLATDGTVKVLDFGTAKALDTRVISGPQTAALTTPAMTEAGIVLGTAQYMSPEQARGKPIDQRADIWAFGCVLCEMLTGQPAFGGEDVTIVLARVLERSANMNALPATISPGVKHTIALCLEKDPRQRLHAIGDVRLALQGKLDVGGQAQRRWRRALISASKLIGTAIIAVAAAWSLRPALHEESAGPPAVSRFVQPIPANQFFASGDRSVLTIAPDGSSVVYTGPDMLYVRGMNEFEPKPIPGTEGGRLPFYSPDGQWIEFTGLGNELYKIPAAGGLRVDLGQVGAPFGASWSEDDKIVFIGPAPRDIYRMSSDGSSAERLIEATEDTRFDGPSLLPGGEWLLFSEGRAGAWDDANVIAQSLVTGERKVLVRRASDARYVPTGHCFMFAAPHCTPRPSTPKPSRCSAKVAYRNWRA
jgi:Protein kinase domain